MRYVIVTLISPLFLALTASVAHADDEQDEARGPEECVRTMILRTPEVIDDETIVFHATRKRYYLNRLPSVCRGLKRQGRISYTKENNLCANDWFNLLERSGTRLTLGISCRLGQFLLINDDELEAIRNPTSVQPDPQPVAPPEIEEIAPESDESSED